MNEQETKKNTSKNKKLTEAQAPRPSEENVENASNNEKYVLYADIMGFKERVMRTKHADLKKELKELRKELYDWLRLYLENVETFKVSFFSDSILIVDENTRDGFHHISLAAVALMVVSLKCKFPIKGAIAKGEFTYEEEDQLFFGQAIIDAFLLEEEVHYYGIVAHHTMEEDIKSFSNEKIGEGDDDNLVSCPYVLNPIPLKDGKITHYHVAYNLLGCEKLKETQISKSTELDISNLEKISGTVSGTPRIYVDNTLQVLKEDLRIYKEKLQKQEVVFPLKAFG
ncbi:hypothetical protein [Porphyromonas endodontalis]|uniref:hypothetical protein n=1 Tax=Porphyromonas endodontalis TaxID=28124 RepID=UPI003C750854